MNPSRNGWNHGDLIIYTPTDKQGSFSFRKAFQANKQQYPMVLFLHLHKTPHYAPINKKQRYKKMFCFRKIIEQITRQIYYGKWNLCFNMLQDASPWQKHVCIKTVVFKLWVQDSPVAHSTLFGGLWNRTGNAYQLVKQAASLKLLLLLFNHPSTHTPWHLYIRQRPLGQCQTHFIQQV